MSSKPTYEELVSKIKRLEQEAAVRKGDGKALKESEWKYKNIYDNAQVGLFRSRVRDGKMLEANQRMAEMFGYETVDECVAKYVAIEHYVYPEKRNYVVETMRTYGKISNFRTLIRKDDGATMWVQFSAFLSPEEDCFEGVATDITELKETEAALRRSEARLNAAQRIANIGSWEIELATQKRFWSDEVFRIFGYEPGEVEPDGEFVIRHIHPDDLDLYLKIRSVAFKENKDVDYKHRIIRKDGKERVCHVIAKVVRDDAGNPIRYSGAYQDITERKRSEEEKLRLEAQLRQAHKMEAIGTLAGGIAHDFNNIIGIVLGNAELAIDDVSEWNPARENLEEIRTACLRAKNVVKQLLSFSRDTEQRKKPVKIEPIIKESMEILRSSIPESIYIRSEIPDDLDIIEADPTQIHQVLINLCTNAAHAMDKEGGVLKVSADAIDLNGKTECRYFDLPPGRYVQLTVSDNGHGIDPIIKDRIFDPYFTTKEVGKGSGMGLSIVHGIVNNHGGAIVTESEHNKGTTVRVLFPAIETAAKNSGE